MNIVAVMLTRNRRATVEVCLPAWAREKGDMQLWCFDDASTEYRPERLLELGADRVSSVEASKAEGAWRIALAIRGALEAVVKTRRDADFILICDSDTYPSAGIRDHIEALAASGSHWLYSLYRSSYQEQGDLPRYRTQRVHDTDTFVRRPGEVTAPPQDLPARRLRLLDRAAAPGCALLIDVASLRDLGFPFGITEASHRKHNGTWDHVLSHELGPVAVCETSLVDHFGRGGLHNPTWETDRAVQPAGELAPRRAATIAEIEAGERAPRLHAGNAPELPTGCVTPAPAPAKPCPTPPVERRRAPDAAARQAAYDPRQYWPERLQVEGPAYVGVGGTRGAATQAAAFLGVLMPALRRFRAAPPCLPRLLDFGCGTGRLTGDLLREHDYHGCDVNGGALTEVAGRFTTRLGQLTSAELPLPHAAGFFDAIVACTVLQHVPERDIEATCAELARVLAPGGRVFLIEDANPEGHRPAPHMSFRGAHEYAKLLGLRPVHFEVLSAERPRSHYLAVFEREG